MIKASIPGKLGGDAETKQAGGTTVTEFSVATDERAKVNGSWEKQTQWVRCAIFGDRGTKLAPYLTKGTSVTVFGSLTMRQYTTKDGKHGASLDLRVDDVTLQGSKSDGERQGRPSHNLDGFGSQSSDSFADGDPDIPF